MLTRKPITLRFGGETRAAELRRYADGTVIGVGLPGGGPHDGSPGGRRFAVALRAIGAALEHGQSLAAARQQAEAVLDLIEQLEDIEARRT